MSSADQPEFITYGVKTGGQSGRTWLYALQYGYYMPIRDLGTSSGGRFDTNASIRAANLGLLSIATAVVGGIFAAPASEAVQASTLAASETSSMSWGQLTTAIQKAKPIIQGWREKDTPQVKGLNVNSIQRKATFNGLTLIVTYYSDGVNWLPDWDAIEVIQ